MENGVIKQGKDENNQVEDDKDGLVKMVKELQTLLKQRKDALENVENEKDLLEKEKLLKETEIKVCYSFEEIMICSLVA